MNPITETTRRTILAGPTAQAARTVVDIRDHDQPHEAQAAARLYLQRLRLDADTEATLQALA